MLLKGLIFETFVVVGVNLYVGAYNTCGKSNVICYTAKLLTIPPRAMKFEKRENRLSLKFANA